MKSDKLIAIYSIFIGISVITLWTMILLTEDITEGITEMTFHLCSEFIMAASCIISGMLILKKMRLSKELNVLAFGMLIYSLLNAAGYYGEKSEFAFMSMFIVLFIITTIVSVIQLGNMMHASKKS